MQFLAVLPILLSFLQAATVSAQDHNSTSTPTKRVETVEQRGLFNVRTDFCITLGSAVTVGNNKGAAKGNVYLAAGICVCIDQAINLGLGGTDVDVVVTTSSGAVFSGDQAFNIAQAISNPFSAITGNPYAGIFTAEAICYFTDISILNANHFSPGSSNCCATTCKTGYTRPSGSNQCYPNCPTGYTMKKDGTCTPPSCKAPTPYLCGGTCVKDAKHCQSGVPTLKKRNGKTGLCPAEMTRCALPVSAWGVQSSGWECVDTKSDIESCGGCMQSDDLFAPRGEDCTAIPNVNEVTCRQGACEIQSCRRGFKLNTNGTSCEEQIHFGGKGSPYQHAKFNIQK